MKFLAIQSTYDSLQLALLHNNLLLETVTIPKFKASTEFVVQLHALLSGNNLAVADLPFIAVNQGPGPFTTLRVVISSINGLSFATQVPLIGVDALDACTQEWRDPKYPYSMVLLNAFGNDVYYAITMPDKTVQKGYGNALVLLEELKKLFPTIALRFLGNGALLHQDLIKELFEEYAFIDKTTEYCSIEQIGLMGLNRWHKEGNGSYQLLPLYLKNHPI